MGRPDNVWLPHFCSTGKGAALKCDSMRRQSKNEAAGMALILFIFGKDVKEP